MIRLLSIFASGLVFVAAHSAFGQTTPTDGPFVLFDSGDTNPISEIFGTNDAGSFESPAPPPNLNGAFPVRTPSMALGRFAKSSWPGESRWRGGPLFLFGGDQHSLSWLYANRERLKSLGATGILIDAPTEASLTAARQAAPNLPLMAASGEEIANATGLRLYPVIITREGIDQ